jgi:hypothetical protein
MMAALEKVLAEVLAGVALAPREVLARDAPGGLTAPGRMSANRRCGLLRAADGRVAINLARAEDLELVPILTGRSGDPWSGLAEWAATMHAVDVRDRAAELQMPVAVLGEAEPYAGPSIAGSRGLGARVIDLSALWAGPLCGALLARAGAEVIKVESVSRPDPTPKGSPQLDQFLNAGKVRTPLDLTSEAGSAALSAMIDDADIIITSARPAALARLGLTPERFPSVVWVAITAHGFTGPGALRTGFGDDCAVAGGLVEWRNDAPHFMGDALADPLTGIEAACRVLDGARGLVDVAMARVAATYAEQIK